MRLLGIDFGEKRIGVALSDENAIVAFAHSVVLNDKNALKNIKKICEENGVEKIILGLSLDYKNQLNPIAEKIDVFKKIMETEIGLPVIYQNETLTTREAERLQGKVANLDASAAALILRSFIERNVI